MVGGLANSTATLPSWPVGAWGSGLFRGELSMLLKYAGNGGSNEKLERNWQNQLFVHVYITLITWEEGISSQELGHRIFQHDTCETRKTIRIYAQ